MLTCVTQGVPEGEECVWLGSRVARASEDSGHLEPGNLVLRPELALERCGKGSEAQPHQLLTHMEAGSWIITRWWFFFF